MLNLFKFFFRTSKNLNSVSLRFIELKNNSNVEKIFKAIEEYSSEAEVRYVGGFIRKIIKKEAIDDIDLATNLKPREVCEALKNKDINFYETGIEHGTVTAIINEYKYEITSLRKDLTTDGRHAKVEFSSDWKEDSLRRDFSINSIYSDQDGNLFDPNNGKKDLEEGRINFIGDAETRIKEDYIRILRYVRFFINYSKLKHKPEIIKIIKRNIDGVYKLSNDRLLDEFKKLTKSNGFLKLFKDNESLELIEIIFPQLKNFKIFKKMNEYAKDNFPKVDFIFVLSLMIIDGTDNSDYFIYKFNMSKKDQKRLNLINNFYKEKVNIKNFNEKNLNKFFYFNGKEAVIDIINFKIFISSKVEEKLVKLVKIYNAKVTPTMPIGADILMTKYNIPEGRTLGRKLKMIEEIWVNNNFNISEKQIQRIAKS